MNSVKQRVARNILRIFAFGMLAVIVMSMFFIAFSSISLTNSGAVFTATAGKADLKNYPLAKQPIFLNGEWDYYPGVFLEADTIAEGELENPQLVEMPLGKFSDAENVGSYRLTLTGGEWENAALYIPNVVNTVNVYLDGKKQNSFGQNSSGRDFVLQNSIYPLFNVEEAEKTHELVISTNQDKGGHAFYKRWIILGTLSGVNFQANIFVANSMLILGILGTILLSGFVFMAMRPGHKMISLLTLFDTVLIFRLIFGMPELNSFLHSLFPWFHLPDQTCLSLQIFFLMMGGVVGAVLANFLFDPENIIPRGFTLPIPFVFGVLACVLPFNITMLEGIGIPIIMVAYAYTFLVVFWQYIIYWRREKGAYPVFQIVKTSYIGVLIFVDLLMIHKQVNFLIIIYLYIIFFLAHTFVRLYDNHQSYQSVEQLNQNLEKTVEVRTAELTRTNQILAELSNKDPLTGTHNRLFIENYMEKALASPTAVEDNLHLCMFDLDHFKQINDRFGHDAGDEQLKYVVTLATSMIGNRAVLARVGGEEFFVFYKGLSSEIVMNNVEALRWTIEKDAKTDERHTTASFGLVRYRKTMTQKELLKLADRCLYKAKNKGRNQVVCAMDEHEEALV